MKKICLFLFSFLLFVNLSFAASIIQIRRDTAANWTSANPTLAQGEIGIETDTEKLKVGNGTTAWSSLTYYSMGTYSGTVNYVPKWNGTQYVDSSITDTGTSGNFDIGGRVSAGNVTSPTKMVEFQLSDSAGADSVIVRNSAGTIIATIGSNGNITATGNPVINESDIYSVGWTDYFSSSTIVGWSSYTADHYWIYTKKVGKTVFVWFHLQGTSNSTGVSFTLPYTTVSIGIYDFRFCGTLGLAYDNGTKIAVATEYSLTDNTNTVKCYTNMSNGGWTASGTKIVSGNFWYQCQ